jgi:hypothetical protein
MIMNDPNTNHYGKEPEYLWWLIFGIACFLLGAGLYLLIKI